MTNQKDTAGKVMTAFYRSCLGKQPTFKDDKIAVAATLRVVVNQLQYQSFHHTEEYYQLDARDILEVADELEQ